MSNILRIKRPMTAAASRPSNESIHSFKSDIDLESDSIYVDKTLEHDAILASDLLVNRLREEYGDLGNVPTMLDMIKQYSIQIMNILFPERDPCESEVHIANSNGIISISITYQ